MTATFAADDMTQMKFSDEVGLAPLALALDAVVPAPPLNRTLPYFSAEGIKDKGRPARVEFSLK